jgi:small subunit ribosomal protein S20
MAHSSSARKRARQSQARRKINRPKVSALRTQLKKTLAAAESGNKEAASQELTKAAKALDKAAQKGLIHKNQASRRKSRLAAKVNKLEG